MTAIADGFTASLMSSFIPNPASPNGVSDPVYGHVRQGWRHSMWAIGNPQLGVAQLTGGSRIVTDHGDGSLSNAAGWLRRLSRTRHVDLQGHRYTLRHVSPRRSKLLRDGTTIGVLRGTQAIGLFHSGPARSYEIVRWTDEADPAGIAVGHLLASRFAIGWLR